MNETTADHVSWRTEGREDWSITTETEKQTTQVCLPLTYPMTVKTTDPQLNYSCCNCPPFPLLLLLLLQNYTKDIKWKPIFRNDTRPLAFIQLLSCLYPGYIYTYHMTLHVRSLLPEAQHHSMCLHVCMIIGDFSSRLIYDSYELSAYKVLLVLMNFHSRQEFKRHYYIHCLHKHTHTIYILYNIHTCIDTKNIYA